MTTWLKRWTGLGLLLWLAGCAVAPAVPPNEGLFEDALFAPPSERIDATEALAMSPAMQAYLGQEIAVAMQRREPHRALLDALYSGRQLKLRYDATRTLNAAEAFEERAGNCMSLVLMTAAFAREMGLQVRYQSVHAAPVWSRQGNLQFTIGHINISVGKPLVRALVAGEGNDWLTVDFLPREQMRGQRHEVIDEATLVAMYMNNRAAEALSAGRRDDAYWWARAAIARDRQLLIAYNTLGVVYQRHGHAAQAERVLRFALALEPANLHVMGNLVQLLLTQGRTAEAQPLQAQLARLQPEPPFKYLDLGLVAMQQGDFRAARRLFERELQRDPDYAELHFWLAVAHYRLGEMDQAARHLDTARANSTTLAERRLYAAKLARLKAESLH
ncbi:MAG: tetratricopeptide repeat protein [Burkholderiales bacterium]|nr:tetratricopeptide repeat protein [Burkholderiales bacterium]